MPRQGLLMEDKTEKPGYASLRRFRESKAGATYFVTANLSERGSGLEAPVLTKLIVQQWQKLETDGSWSVRTAVVMPDHIHLFAQLIGDGSLAKCLRLLKGRVSPALRIRGLKWQEGFYEHRLRESEHVLPVFLYIYLNPYRAGLLSTEQTWSGYYCMPEDWKWFGEMTRDAVPQPEWLR